MDIPVFRFGKNWQHFNDVYLNDERVNMAVESIQNFLGIQTLEGKTFLDIGAGSGIYSLAALKLGAAKVISFDADPDSVTCCRQLKEKADNPPLWEVIEGSILDDAFVSTIEICDIVYSWGVLHHTGNMWKGIENSFKLVKKGGVFFLAIYNKADGFGVYPDGRFGPSSFWLMEKKFYTSLPLFFQNVIDYAVMSALCVLYVVTLQNPVRVIREHKQYFNKGMSWRINIKDWLGGYPYEYATVAEIFLCAKKHGFVLDNLTCNNGLLNNEFLLRRVS